MIANLKIVKGMELPPNACCICGGNGSDEKGVQEDAIFAPGVDIDWGGSLYICKECAEIIADLMGRSPVSGFDALQTRYNGLSEDFDALKKKYEDQAALIERIRDGVRAKQKLKETV